MSTEVPDCWNRPIFIASMGRSGSTLLQRVLNVHPKVTIWGEHAGFLTGILRSYKAVSEPNAAENLIEGYSHKDKVVGELTDKTTFNPWVSPFVPNDLEGAIVDMMRGLFTRELTPDIRWGFKEIRYKAAQFAVLMEMFPQAHLVILARDLEGYAQSRFFAFGNTDFDLDSEQGRHKAHTRLDNILAGWIERYSGLLNLYEQNPGRCSVVAYGDLVVGSDRPAKLFGELGESTPDQSVIDEVLTAVAGSSFKFNSRARSARADLAAMVSSANIDWDEHARLSKALGL